MANTLIKDHHNLRRNLNLNDKYISNDGGDEGIRITDGGYVGIGVSDPDRMLEIFETTVQPQLKISNDANNHCGFNVAADGELTINSIGTAPAITLTAGEAGSEGDINLQAMDGDVFMYAANNYTNAMHFDI